jgi:capsular exopolysaccharide synthesis family protein
VTSTRAGEGKTLTAVNLALAMALDGRQVILVDADLRWPSVHQKLDLQPSPGLTDVLAGHCTLEQALQSLPGHEIRVLTSGPIPTNPAELLNTARMQGVIEQLQGQADTVIFDTPPCVPFTDAQVLGTKLDGMLLVAEIGEARLGDIHRARELLDQARIRLLGVVANKTAGGRSRTYVRYANYRGGSANGNGSHAPTEALPESPADPAEVQTRSKQR